MKSMGSRLLKAAIGLFASGMIWAGSAPEAFAQTPLLSYAAKFKCGIRTVDVGVVRGVYETTINIHNPHFVQLIIRKKAVIALPQRATPRPPSALRNHLLLPDYALGMDCIDIRNLFATPPVGFIEGYVVIYTARAQPVDVVSNITGRPRTGTNPDASIYDVSTIALERVTPINVVAP